MIEYFMIYFGLVLYISVIMSFILCIHGFVNESVVEKFQKIIK